MSLPPPSLLAPGMRLDRYELICPIAEGGMASVWIARQRGKHGFERLVALKTILPKYASEGRFQSMFVDEARLSARLKHDNVAQILDVGEQHGTTYLVMEYVDGDSLSTIHKTVKKHGAQIPAGVLLRIMADVCGGLHAAHELQGEAGNLLGVVHRDVSPHNILVSANGDAKLIDFGIAKARDRLTADTNTGTIKGKIRYMAPEQAVGGAIDRRADLWAIGAIVYDVLAGRPPYDGGNDVQTILALTSGRPPLPLPESVPDAVAAVVLRALTANPDARFATAAEMQQSIEEAMVASSMATSVTSVAAFLTQHMTERTQRRADSIAMGIRAATEREYVVSVLRSSVGSIASSPTVSDRKIADLLAARDAAAADGREITGTTLRSAAMGLGLPRPVSKRTLVVGLAAVAVTVAVAAALLPAGLKARPVAQAAAPAPPSALATAAPAETPSAPPVPSSAPSAAAEVTPSTAAAAPAPAPPARSAAPAARTVHGTPRAAPVRESPRAPKARVDDGF